MKPAQKPVQKSPYNNPPVKLRAQIIPQKIIKKKPVQSKSSESESSSEQSSYDSQVQDFANEFYDDEVKNADKSLQEKKDNNNDKQQGQQQANKQKLLLVQKKSKKPPTQWDKISSRLKQLKGNFTDLDMDSLLFRKKDQNKLKQIAQFLSKKHKQKRQFMKRLKKIKNSQKQRHKIQQQISKKKQKQQHEKRLKQIRSISQMIKQKIQKKKQQQEDRLEDIEAFYQQFHKKYNKRKLYKMMELSDRKKRNKQYQKQQQYLKQRRNVVSQVISHQEMIEFDKRRQQYLKDSQKVKNTQKQQKSQQIMQKNRQLREKIYISNKYMQMQEQSVRKEKMKKVPEQKLNRIKKYNLHIRENFMPINSRSEEDGDGEEFRQKEYETLLQEIVEIDGKMYRRLKKDRYLKGIKIGQITVNIPVPKTDKQQKMVGNSYLQQLKLLPKKRPTSLDLSRRSQQLNSRSLLQLPKQSSSTPRIQINKINKKMGKISLSKNAGRHEIENLINSLKAKDQLISRQQHYLKAVNRGMQNKEELDENMIDNIQKKINLLGRL